MAWSLSQKIRHPELWLGAVCQLYRLTTYGAEKYSDLELLILGAHANSIKVIRVLVIFNEDGVEVFNREVELIWDSANKCLRYTYGLKAKIGESLPPNLYGITWLVYKK